ncbi:hypothetical protein [Chryseobacterium sp. CCH4-E10]|jgi:hypothetical protein|uniref:hypothetical protein n=1 Tax=Chryseobacterium sp. CCH4-E10 TaxID=1768758 RepID=UPI00082C9BC4|nr:hypothetical protein [Chryseobacterium sp. CCH4-E10]
MKKIITLLFGLTLGASTFAQIDPATGQGTIHIWNTDDYHSLNLNFTLFTLNPTTCSPDFQSLGPSIPLPPGELTKYSKYTDSDTAAGHPYPIDSWYDGSIYAPSAIPPGIVYDQRWAYVKFELREPSNPGQYIPGMSGSVGFYQSCTGIPDYLAGSGTSSGGTNYNFEVKAYVIGGDLWVEFH